MYSNELKMYKKKKKIQFGWVYFGLCLHFIKLHTYTFIKLKHVLYNTILTSTVTCEHCVCIYLYKNISSDGSLWYVY